MARIIVNIGGRTFTSKRQLIKYLSAHLGTLSPGDPVKDDEITSILTELMFVRVEKIQELGDRKILSWEIEGNPKNQCFAARLSDGELLHMSFYESVNDWPGLLKPAS